MAPLRNSCVSSLDVAPPSSLENWTASHSGPFGHRLVVIVTGPPPSTGYAVNATSAPPSTGVPDEPPSGPRQKASAPMSPPTIAVVTEHGSVTVYVTPTLFTST